MANLTSHTLNVVSSEIVIRSFRAGASFLIKPSDILTLTDARWSVHGLLVHFMSGFSIRLISHSKASLKDENSYIMEMECSVGEVDHPIPNLRRVTWTERTC